MPMKSSETDLKTPLARVRGLGSAHDGVRHWIHQRVTALVAIPLLLWLVWSLATMQSWAYADFTAWEAAPVHAILMILTVIIVFYHSALGVQVILEDYVHGEGWKFGALVVNHLLFFVFGLACVFSVLKVAFGHNP
jgi:succinate dehydrogenase / fumarate reductase membrane anchor subunit